ncbi:hypothetical protein RP20_CCG009368 [Aedes albopictus]|nr:hypothetical protein RP20_CCG009368 [Aedes albopictus]
MRRTRRGRYWHMGIVFLIYSSFHAYSATIGNTATTGADFDELSEPEVPASNESPLYYSTSTAEPGEDEDATTESATKATYTHHGHPTWRPRRENCTPPAIEQFPRPLMGPSVRIHGGLVIHVLVAVFTFLGLAIVCDDYFVSSLDRICEELKLSPDVAGATFMAAGSSAPELLRSIRWILSILVVVSVVLLSVPPCIWIEGIASALCSGTVLQLNWWPLVRDCAFYAISILVMLVVIFNDVISWVEALIMMLFYVVYCVVLHFNSPLEKWAHTWNLPIKLPTKEEQSALVTYKNLPDTTYTQGQQAPAAVEQPEQPQQQPQPVADQGYMDPNSSWDPNAAWGENNAAAPPTNNYASNTFDPNAGWDGQQNYGYDDQYGQDPANATQQPPAQPVAQTTTTVTTGAVQPTVDDYYKPKEPRPQESHNPLLKPTEGGPLKLVGWYIVYPIHYTARKTMPDCKTEKYKNWYPFTFLVSMIWISFYSYFMVWMITIIGSTLGIPDTVMGLTFVAAGVSVPDALSSIAVIKEGYGDMAVSNAVGSNVFDILICLGLPWFIQTAIIKPGSHVNVISKGLTYSTLSLLSTVVFLLVATHMNGWKLDKRLGIVLMVWYLIFITIASLYELNYFGQLNPPECPSELP